MNTDYNVISMGTEAMETVLPKETWGRICDLDKSRKIGLRAYFAATHTEQASNISLEAQRGIWLSP